MSSVISGIEYGIEGVLLSSVGNVDVVIQCDMNSKISEYSLHDVTLVLIGQKVKVSLSCFPTITIVAPNTNLHGLNLIGLRNKPIPRFDHYPPDMQLMKQSIVYIDQENEIFTLRSWMRPGDAACLFAYCMTRLNFKENIVKLGGKEFRSERLTCYCGDVKTHNYSGVVHEVEPWYPLLHDVRVMIQNSINTCVNAALVNYYEDGTKYINPHSDTGLTGDSVVACLSLGQERKFKVDAKDQSKSITIDMQHGDLVVMKGPIVQQKYKHSVTKDKSVSPRISITYRQLPYM